MLFFSCLQSSTFLTLLPFFRLLMSFLPSLSFHLITASFPVYLISSVFAFSTPLPLCLSLSLLFFTSVFMWRRMRNWSQLVDAGVSNILSAHCSFGDRSLRRTPVIFPLHLTQDYIWQPHVWRGGVSGLCASICVSMGNHWKLQLRTLTFPGNDALTVEKLFFKWWLLVMPKWRSHTVCKSSHHPTSKGLFQVWQ